ncbi:hypothetical protein [Alkalibacillus haloalkaliphilus]|uniref:DUF4871 domain-containing protein n=1 Tax=Alkalibacillus haloalkaliphilus TaxID=94136 RepID=A0A511W422_9BACI|nr:hypothetical protein [Alkalibacillus haloalkaliphilus]GEN45717.1 hypothetical protein AHA02nite_14930 [Alkalibacillus haloalkaliphilus]
MYESFAIQIYLFWGAMMNRVLLVCIICSLIVMVACTLDETDVQLPENIPEFVREGDFAQIDWDKKAVTFNNNIVGNKDKSGVIGTDMPSINNDQKWMWHLWGVEEPYSIELSVIGFHKGTETVHEILTDGWLTGLSGENNGADAHSPSTVNIPKSGDWAILLYTNGELFDILIYEITE